MKILIIGGAGFIGSNLVKFLIKKEHEVYAVDNLVTGNKKNIETLLNNNLFHFIEKDIIDYDFADLPSFDLVYDLASPASPAVFASLSEEILKVNSVGLLNVMNFFIKSKSKTFVFASTSEVYGDPKVDPQPETYFGNVNSYGPRACYDEGKRFAEAVLYSYIQKYNVDVRIARIFNTYGPFMNPQDGRVISNFINQAINNKPLTVYGDGAQTRSCCYVTDMVEGLYLLGTTQNIKGEVVNIGNPDERTILEIAALIKKMTDSKSEVVYKDIGADDPKKRCPDVAKSKKILNWEAKVDLEKGLQLTIEYFKNL